MNLLRRSITVAVHGARLVIGTGAANADVAEARDPVALHDDTRRGYQCRVPMLLPWPKRRRAAD